MALDTNKNASGSRRQNKLNRMSRYVSDANMTESLKWRLDHHSPPLPTHFSPSSPSLNLTTHSFFASSLFPHYCSSIFLPLTFFYELKRKRKECFLYLKKKNTMLPLPLMLIDKGEGSEYRRIVMWRKEWYEKNGL